MKIRLLKFIVAAALIAVASFPTAAREITVDGIVYELYEYNYVAIANGRSSKGRVVIPEQVSDGTNTYTVTGITSFGERPITEVVIPGTVVNIPQFAFGQCVGLTSVEMQEGVETIGYRAFGECSSLININLPPSLKTIEDDAFADCKSLRSLDIPESVTYIGFQAFASCISLEKVTLPESLTTLKNQAFNWCRVLMSITIPSKIEIILDDTFGCTAIRDVIFKGSDVMVGINAFNSGVQRIAYPAGTTRPAHLDYALAVEFPADAVVEDGFIYSADRTELLYAPVNLTGHFDVPEAVRVIGAKAFARCEGLTSVTLPSSLESIGDSCFHGCTALADVAMAGSVPPSVAASSFDESHFSAIRLSVPYTGYVAYKTHEAWGRFAKATATGGAFVDKITLSETYLFFPPGQFRELTATVEPADATVNTVVWSSSNEAVARVVGGMVLGISNGEAIITATATDGSGVTASCQVVIGQPVLVERLESAYENGEVELRRMPKANIKLKDYYAANFEVYPSNATNKLYKLSSSDTTIVAIYSDYHKNDSLPCGILPLRSGEAVITATALDGSGVTGSFKVIVPALPKGDSNADYYVNIADAMMTANYSVGRAVSEDFDFEASDVDEDGLVTIADAVGTVSIILDGESDATAAPRREPEAAEPDYPEVYLSQPHARRSNPDSGYWTDIALLNKHEYYGLQTTIILPEGMSFVTQQKFKKPYIELNDRCDSTFTYVYKLVSSRELRVALFSTKHHAITEVDGNVFHVGINVSQGYEIGEVKLVNTRLVNAADRSVVLSDVSTPFEPKGYTVYTTDIRCERGQKTTVPLRLASWAAISGIQVDITPSEGLSIDPASVRAAKSCSESHQVWAQQIAGGKVRVVCMSMAGDYFDTSVLYGPMFEFDLKASADAPDEGKVDFSNITLIDAEANYDYLRDYSHSVMILDRALGDEPTAVDSPVADSPEAAISVKGCEVTVTGLDEGSPVMVYDLQGRLILSAEANGPVTTLTLAQSGYYMVVTAGHSWKISVR